MLAGVNICKCCSRNYATTNDRVSLVHLSTHLFTCCLLVKSESAGCITTENYEKYITHLCVFLPFSRLTKEQAWQQRLALHDLELMGVVYVCMQFRKGVMLLRHNK